MNQNSQETKDRLYRIRHSLAHVCAQAVLEHYPQARLGFGPPTEDGFYYDFDFNGAPPQEKDLPRLEETMRRIIAARQPFTRTELQAPEALAKAAALRQNYKTLQIENLRAKGETCFSFYDNGPFSDLCEGPHVAHTGELPAKAFHLDHIAGAYWLGSERNKMLTRIYACAFESDAELAEHLRRRELARERDHKKLGKELELFTFSPMVGKGLPLWLPNGCVIRDCIEQYAREMEFRYGYQRVATPHITRAELYVRSQHLPAYKESMFPPMVIEDRGEDGVVTGSEEYYLKPMNCPHHHMIYAHRPVSYRELPMRLAEYGTCYRFEQSGELNGLLRVRSLCMNDAHIYLAEDQVKEEFRLLLKMYGEFYATFGLKDYRYRLSLRGTENREKFRGSDEMWDRAERILREVLEETAHPFDTGIGEAAFYGPKLDVQFKNLLGREETVSTIQIDFLGPENFDLNYTAPDGQPKRPVIIHRAPLSTHERFISFLIEAYGGAFPTWCAPLQVAIIPVREDVLGYARGIESELRNLGVRAEVDTSQNSFNKKIRSNLKLKIPNLLILGDKERDSGAVTWRRYGEEGQEQLASATFRERLLEEIRARQRRVPANS